ncbi:MAG: oligosaccharide flippase family protein [Pseudomonadota bacterium]
MSQKKKILVAGFWVILIFGLSQIIRLGSNLVVTRIFEPEIFGVMAIVTVVAIGIAMFSDLGLWAFVVRHKDPTNPRLLSAVWTIQVIRGWLTLLAVGLIALIIMFGNEYFPQFFEGVYADPRLPILIFVAGIPSVINGYRSMASPVMSRQMQHGKLELMELASQILSVAVVIAWVLVYPSIWALAAAGIVSSIVGTFLSYRLFPFRHSLVWDRAIAKEVFDFGKWIVVSSILTYLFMQGDKLFLAGKITASELGVYSIAFMLSGVLVSVTNSIAAKIVFPTLSSAVHEDRKSLKEKYYKIRIYVDLSNFLAAGILIALAPTIVELLYDARYSSAGWMFQILMFSLIGNALALIPIQCLSALSVTKLNMWVMMVRSVGLLVGLPVFYHFYGLYGAVWVVAVIPFLALPIIYWNLAQHAVFSFYKEIRMLPVVGLGYIFAKCFLYLIS